MVLVPQKLIVHYNHCSIKNVGETFIDYINVQLFFLKNVLNCPFVYLVEETHPISNYKGFPYAFNTLEGNILYGEDIINYMKNLYLFDSVNYETYYGIVSELKAILIYYLWEDEQIYNNFTKKIYQDNFFYLYYIYIIRKLKSENLEKCKTFGLDNHNFNIKRLKEILNILDSILCDDAHPPKEDTICYFHSICFSILSIFYSIPLKYNNELLDTLMSKPNLINFVKNLNSMYNVWKNEKSFLLGVR
ncbi:conserved Plasmodium protein, unknown function [Plasmodium chabaudi adami]|uniref:Metaxin-2 n=1 Tax=Plasmodium chabaudi adami TaxID=5826 RepID=A0A1D3LLH9_PLACE|nr:conserved Plasmodium protein, unknown function [Plasmodium chabaudi adami]